MSAKRKLPVAITIEDSFKPNLEQLPPVDDIASIKLTPVGKDDAEPDVIENMPGKAGSVRVYKYLLDLYGPASARSGVVTRQAAYLGCAIYAEHTEDAHKNPGKHGNIDRLFKIIETGEVLNAEVVVKAEEAKEEAKADA